MALLKDVPEDKYLQSQGVAVSPPAPTQGYLPQPSTLVLPPPGPPPPHFGIIETYILGIPFGFLGAHHWYLRRWGFGVLYLFTLGLFGVGWVADWFRIPALVKEANERWNDPTMPRRKSLAEAYILWLPGGFFGFHHFYLNRRCWGVAYLCTLGGFGIGWIIDAFRMPSLVKTCNAHLEETPIAPPPGPKLKSQGYAYCLALIPLTGLLGGHHYYLGRTKFGVLYTFTFGVLGVGWLVDLVRTPYLVKRTNKGIQEGRVKKRKYLDDAYICLFPLGIFGLHHFYLNRPCWGILYMLTFGCAGIGFIVDFFRLPCLVRQCNEQLDASQHLIIVPPGTPNYTFPSSHIQGQVPSYLHHGQGPVPPYQAGSIYPNAHVTGHSNAGYASAGFSSWSTLGSDAGHHGNSLPPLSEQPPSYNQVLSQTHPGSGQAGAPEFDNSGLTKAPPPSGVTGPSAPPPHNRC